MAPLRFGAGMKGKIGQALAYALPVITTPVSAEGLGLRDGENAVIAEADPRRFARSDRFALRRRRAMAADLRRRRATLQPFSPETVALRLQELLEQLSALRRLSVEPEMPRAARRASGAPRPA